LTYAVKIISRDDLNNLLPNVSEDSPEYRRIFENDLIYLGTFGLVDPLRENIAQTINLLQYGQEVPEDKQPKAVTVRIISGDHLETAKRVAVDAGIVKQEEINIDGVALSGEEFRRRIGNFEIVHDQFGIERIKF